MSLDRGRRPGERPAGRHLPVGPARRGPRPAVQISEVSKTFGRGETALLALDRVSLSVAPGEFVCLIGASGCGKSTLLSLVAGLDTPTSGEVSTGGPAGVADVPGVRRCSRG